MVQNYCVIRESTVGAGVVDGAVLAHPSRQPSSAQGAHVGNFVELKKTRLGAGSKANHLAYLGDATIGANVNVGAGTITCNYDGEKKQQTVIEDGAFIGSDSQLVAPVTHRRGRLRRRRVVDHARTCRPARWPSRGADRKQARLGREAESREGATKVIAPGTAAAIARTVLRDTSCAASSATSAPSRSSRSSSRGCGASSIAATTRRAWRVVQDGTHCRAAQRRASCQPRGRAAGRRRSTATTASATRAGRRTAGRPRRTPIRTATAPAASSSSTTASSRTTSSSSSELQAAGPQVPVRDRHRGRRPPGRARDCGTATVARERGARARWRACAGCSRWC